MLLKMVVAEPLVVREYALTLQMTSGENRGFLLHMNYNIGKILVAIGKL